MAVVESIPEKNQTPSAQKGVLDYCMQPSKTFDEDEQLAYISGYNCIPELANESFLATQKIFGHEPDGVRFYHFVQSFKRVNALLHDNRTILREGEDIEDWEEVQRKQREIEAERQKKEQEILATWFLREEYINAGWFKRFLLRLEFLFRDTRGKSHIPQIPEHIRKEIARCLLPDIVAYFESEQGQREFEEWKAQQESAKKEKSEVA